MKFNKLSTALLVAGISLPGLALATNGDNLIGLGAQSRALGGTGTAAFFGSENALSNPALLGKMQGTEFAFGGTAFMPDVKAKTTDEDYGMTMTSGKSAADMFGIPEVSTATRINDNWTFGIGMYGTSGMGVDYRKYDNLFNAYSNLQMMKFVPALAYNNGGFNLGIAPVIQYGALDINYTGVDMGTGDPVNVGHGSSSDFGYGYNVGTSFDLTDGLTLGLAYQSEIAMKYDGVLTTAADGFGIGPNGMGTITSDKLAQPSEVKAGIAYVTGPWTVTGDYKRVYWGHADGYKDFNWKDQDVFGVGMKYSGSGWWFGLGYNHASDPIKKLGAGANPGAEFSNEAVNMFNNMFFPAIVEDHYTVGGGFALGKNTSIDLAYVHADKVSKTIGTTAITTGLSGGVFTDTTSQTTTHSQDGITVSVRMNF